MQGIEADTHGHAQGSSRDEHASHTRSNQPQPMYEFSMLRCATSPYAGSFVLRKKQQPPGTRSLHLLASPAGGFCTAWLRPC